MEFVQKTFDELTNRELYEILRAREAVFVVEQNSASGGRVDSGKL